MKERLLKPLPLLLPALLLLGTGAALAERKDETPTVGFITRSNGLTRDRWYTVTTPSTLRFSSSDAYAPDIRKAIEHYDAIVELKAEPETMAEAMRRAADLRVQLAEAGEDRDGQMLARAISLYKRIIVRYPDYTLMDRVLYQLARAEQNGGDTDAAIAHLSELGNRFPKSLRTGDSVFRAAELQFARGRYAEAEHNYRIALNQGPGTPFFEPAQYKYGWALYKQGRFEETIPVFFAVLDRTLPAGPLDDAKAVLAGVNRAQAEVATDALRVTGLSFAALGGGRAVNEYYGRSGKEPRFSTLVYGSLGALLLEKRRYTDAAGAFTAFVERHPAHALAPQFSSRAIAALEQGGFTEPVVKAKEDYVNLYAPGAPRWAGQQPPAEVIAELHKHLDDLGPYYQAKAQRLPEADSTGRKTNFAAAATWYRRSLELFPRDAHAPEISMHLADSLYDGGSTLEASDQYLRTAYDYGAQPRAAEAAYAAVQADQRLTREVPSSEQSKALRRSVADSLKLADRFPAHPQWAAVLTRAAEDLFDLKDHEQAITVTSRVLAAPAVPTDLRRQDYAVLADSRFALKQYPEAEAAYTELLKLQDPASPQRRQVVEQLAASIYKQGEAARDKGDLRGAALAFQRVGRVAPEAGIRAGADYDAASAFVQLQDWVLAEAALESFRSLHPKDPLIADADKKLALAYQKDNKPAQAAEVFGRIALRSTESADTRRDAALLSAQLYDQAKMPAQTTRAYEAYLSAFPQPLDPAMAARQRLAELAQDTDRVRYEYWLKQIVSADSAAGAAGNDGSRLMAAQASLELGRIQAANARALSLSAPVDKSLPRRKAAVETAIATFGRAAAYGYAEVTTAATYELATVYRDFGRALLASERPAKLGGDALDQYKLLLEEQADPFEEKAIQAHLVNLQRVRQGLWNDWVRRSASALAELAPARYGKQELREDRYESLP